MVADYEVVEDGLNQMIPEAAEGKFSKVMSISTG